ncbi:hypothetical protein [Actinacidiphila sp. ITFR-21]|uniref:hypothetical protein n=1 Tax=Actinacidiphila sp. ITFR-21 TaxID=3075199 RepID=UPI00288C37F3|nr:hypothetical protein [Streptomyces sp. ITFR-21]WNI16921.1 hypothetical protein RLT57_16255 [Streptomyces sp. ITFR-21]
MTVIHVVTEQDVIEHRPALIAWAKANGLEPRLIDQCGLTIEQVGDRQMIVYTEHQVGAHGAKIIDPDRNEVLKIPRSRTLTQPLPEGIGQRVCTCTLSARCPACCGTEPGADTEGDQAPGG